MKNASLFVSAIIIIGLFTFALQAQTFRITIVYTNDSHSYLTASGPRNDNLQASIGGIAKAATIIKQIRSSEKNVVTLHAGDFSMGDMMFNSYFGVPELKLMKDLGFDAMTLGNHEFDLGPTKLEEVLDSAFAGGKFPLLSANAILNDSVAGLRQYIIAHTIKQFGLIKVGIFGMTTPETNVFSNPSPIGFDENMLVIAKDEVTSLISSGCTFVIMLSHLGMTLDKIIAQAIPGINLIVGGHDHLLTQSPIGLKNLLDQTTYIVQEDGFYAHIGKIQFDIGLTGISFVSHQNIEINSSVQEDTQTKNRVDALIADMESKLGHIYTQKIGDATDDFEEVADLQKNGNMDTPIGNLVTDAFRAKTNTDIGIEVGGSTSHKLFKGLLTRADIFRVFGYGFNDVDGLGYRIATFKMDGASLWVAIESVLGMTDAMGDEMLPQVSGMQFSCNLKNIPGSRLISLKVGGQPLDPQKIYTVTANEFLVFSVQGMTGITISDLNLLNNVTEYLTLLEYVIAHSPISPVSTGRVTDIKQSKSDQRPLAFRLEQNYPNPFNPATTISFSLEKNSNVDLRVYNLLGEEVVVLINSQVKPAGINKVTFDGKGLSSAVYIYRLRLNNQFTEERKMMLMK
jgi:5'-nucleotidase / UDP-sugar diphosphatase